MPRKPCARAARSAASRSDLPEQDGRSRRRPASSRRASDTAIAPRGPASGAKNAILPGSSIGNPKVRQAPRSEGRGPSPKRSRRNRSGSPKDHSRPSARSSAAEGRESRRSAKREGGPEWKPKGSFKPERSTKADWKPQIVRRAAEGGLETKIDWKPRPELTAKRPWTGNPGVTPAIRRKARMDAQGRRRSRARGARMPDAPEKRKWVPKAEYKKSLGIEAKKDKNWRPGGEHKDPRQKYKDAKKAKWGRFKQTVRKRWEAKGRRTTSDLARRAVPPASHARPRPSAKRWLRRCSMRSAASRPSAAPPSASASCSTGLAMKQQMAEHFEYSAILEFDSEADLRAYLDHPAHVDLGSRLFTAAEAVLAYDFKDLPLDQI